MEGKKQYKIGEFAEKLGVSVGFLKHHEKFGLLTPYTSGSGHRYYTVDHALQVFRYMNLQGLGFSVKESSALLCHADEIDFAAEMGKKRQQNCSELERLQHVIHYMDDVSTRELGKFDTVTWGIQQEPDIYYLEFSRNGELSGDRRINTALGNWINYFPMVTPCFVFDMDPQQTGRVASIRVGLSLPAETAETLSGFDPSAAQRISPKKSMFYVVRKQYVSDDICSSEYAGELLSEPIAFMKEHNFPIPATIYGYSGFSSASSAHKMMDLCVIMSL